jgi:hypothetical protein
MPIRAIEKFQIAGALRLCEPRVEPMSAALARCITT